MIPRADSKHHSSARQILCRARKAPVKPHRPDPTGGADTLLALTERARRKGFDTSVRPRDGGMLECGQCGAQFHASAYDLRHQHRLEGASDVDDMLLLVAGRCPHCAAGSALALGFGPNASPTDVDILSALDDSRAEPLLE